MESDPEQTLHRESDNLVYWTFCNSRHVVQETAVAVEAALESVDR